MGGHAVTSSPRKQRREKRDAKRKEWEERCKVCTPRNLAGKRGRNARAIPNTIQGDALRMMTDGKEKEVRNEGETGNK